MFCKWEIFLSNFVTCDNGVHVFLPYLTRVQYFAKNRIWTVLDARLMTSLYTGSSLRSSSIMCNPIKKLNPCDFCWYFSNACRFLHEILYNRQTITCILLSLSFVKICLKMTKLCCSNEDYPQFLSVPRVKLQANCSRFIETVQICIIWSIIHLGRYAGKVK